MKDLYRILEIHGNANIDEIKKAYRRLALKYHPDKNSGDTTFSIKFHEINEAYEILGDLKTKSEYDKKWEQFNSIKNQTKEQKEYTNASSDIENLIIDWIAQEFKKMYSVELNLQSDTLSLSRVKGFANKAFKELQENGKSTVINIPYIAFVNGQKVHFQTTLTIQILKELINKKRDKNESKYSDSETVNSQSFLHFFQNLKKRIDGIESSNINQEMLFNSIDDVLSELNIRFLISTGESKIIVQIVEEILQCCKPLSYQYIELLTPKLVRIADSNQALNNKITSFTNRKKIRSKLEKFRGVGILIIFITVIGTVYYLQTDHTYTRTKTSTLNNTDLEKKKIIALTPEQKYQQEREALIKDGWVESNVNNGQLSSCYNFKPKKGNVNNHLEVNVGSGTDVAIKVINLETEKCVRYVFINSKSSYTIRNIPEGKYYLKIAYGKNWMTKDLKNTCLGKFIRNPMYEKGTDIMDFNRVIDMNGVSIPSFKLSLDVISTDISNSFNSHNITEGEFNN